MVHGVYTFRHRNLACVALVLVAKKSMRGDVDLNVLIPNGDTMKDPKLSYSLPHPDVEIFQYYIIC